MPALIIVDDNPQTGASLGRHGCARDRPVPRDRLTQGINRLEWWPRPCCMLCAAGSYLSTSSSPRGHDPIRARSVLGAFQILRMDIGLVAFRDSPHAS